MPTCHLSSTAVECTVVTLYVWTALWEPAGRAEHPGMGLISPEVRHNHKPHEDRLRAPMYDFISWGFQPGVYFFHVRDHGLDCWIAPISLFTVTTCETALQSINQSYLGIDTIFDSAFPPPHPETHVRSHVGPGGG